MEVGLIFQLIVGLGMIGGMWKLVREVASLSATLKMYVCRTEDHEVRLRLLEGESHE